MPSPPSRLVRPRALIIFSIAAAALVTGCRSQRAGLNLPTERADAAASDGAGAPTPIEGSPTPDAAAPGDVAPPPASDASAALDTAPPPIDATSEPPSCTVGATRCAVGAAVVEGCHEGGAWQVKEACASVCVNGACAGKCRPGDRHCGANQTPATCTAMGDWQPEAPCPALCTGAGQCTVCTPDVRRCNAAGTGVEECKKDGSGYADSQACSEGCQGDKCNLCAPGSKMCSGTTLRTCRSNGAGWDEQPCKAPPGGGGEAACSADTCDVTCAPGRVKTGNRCACPGNMVDCAGACVPPTSTIEVPMFDKKCALPISESCDPYNFPIMIESCARQVEVTLQAAASHCAPIYLQMLANGTPKGARSAAIPPGQFSLPIGMGALGPGPITLGFQATVARAGCGVPGLLSGWAGSARITLTVR